MAANRKAPTRSGGNTTAPKPPRKAQRGFFGWLRVHQVTAAFVAGLGLIAAVVGAAVSMQQDATVNPQAKAPLVVFAKGTDFDLMQTAGFAANFALSNNNAAVTLDVYGVAGAAQVSLTKVLKVTNSDATHPESITLTTSGTINAAITSLVITVTNNVPTTITWDAVSGGTSSAINLPASSSADISFTIVETAAASGSLGSFTLHVNLVPT